MRVEKKAACGQTAAAGLIDPTRESAQGFDASVRKAKRSCQLFARETFETKVGTAFQIEALKQA